MRPEHKAIRRRANVVVNAKLPPAGTAQAYAGPVFGPCSLAPSIGTMCIPCAEVEPEARPAPAPCLPYIRWHHYSITLGTGWGTYLTLCKFGRSGNFHLSVDVTLHAPRDQPLLAFEDAGKVICACDDYLTVAAVRIALKPRALALAIRWLEAHELPVTRVDCALPF